MVTGVVASQSEASARPSSSGCASSARATAADRSTRLRMARKLAGAATRKTPPISDFFSGRTDAGQVQLVGDASRSVCGDRPWRGVAAPALLDLAALSSRVYAEDDPARARRGRRRTLADVPVRHVIVTIVRYFALPTEALLIASDARVRAPMKEEGAGPPREARSMSPRNHPSARRCGPRGHEGAGPRRRPGPIVRRKPRKTSLPGGAQQQRTCTGDKTRAQGKACARRVCGQTRRHKACRRRSGLVRSRTDECAV